MDKSIRKKITLGEKSPVGRARRLAFVPGSDMNLLKDLRQGSCLI
jgi:hypothetical protein